MKKIALSILTLGLSLSALPVLATPSQHDHSRGKSEARASRSAKHANLELRFDARDNQTIDGRGKSSQRSRFERGGDGSDWKREWPTRPTPAGGGSLVPEPSAVTLFGLGLLVALQAIPRSSSRVDSTVGAKGTPEHG